MNVNRFQYSVLVITKNLDSAQAVYQDTFYKMESVYSLHYMIKIVLDMKVLTVLSANKDSI